MGEGMAVSVFVGEERVPRWKATSANELFQGRLDRKRETLSN